MDNGNVMLPTVLLVEDSPDDAFLLRLALEQIPGGGAFRVRHVETLDAAFAVLWSKQVDVVLLDLALPDSFGLGTLELLLGEAPHTPVVVLTGLADDEAAVQAVAMGAQDYIVKGVESASIARTLHQAIVRHRHETTGAAGELAMAYRTTHDPLTGLPNRFLFVDRLHQSVARARRYREPVGLLTLRLCSAPWNGEGRESETREAVLRETARRLQARTRRSDTVARIEDQMFAVLLERAHSRRAVGGHLQALLQALELPVSCEGSRVSVRTKPGLAFCPEDGGDGDALLHAALSDAMLAHG